MANPCEESMIKLSGHVTVMYGSSFIASIRFLCLFLMFSSCCHSFIALFVFEHRQSALLPGDPEGRDGGGVQSSSTIDSRLTNVAIERKHRGGT